MYNGTILKSIDAAPNIKILQVKINGQINFTPGQFAMLSLSPVKNEDGMPVRKSYSIASSPSNKDYLEFCIKIVPNGKLTPNLAKLKIGDAINVEGPFGKFIMDKPQENGKKYLLVAAGSGIAPLMSMIRFSLPDTNKRIMLVYGFRNPEDFCYKDELTMLARKHSNFKVYPTISSSNVPENWKLDTGRVTEVVGKYAKSDEVDSAYVCGNPQMVRDTIECLKSLGIPEELIHKEQW